MASPEELRLEQKTRALRLKEDALTRQAQTQLRTETRLISTQEEVAQKERANRLKMQELKAREHKLEEDKRLNNKEVESLALRQAELESKQSTSNFIILPMLLIVCIVGGYLAFDYINQQKLQYNQIALASKNIDKLANILNITQEEVIDKSSALKNKKIELDRTKTMLVDLKTTSDQLQTEITKLKDTQLTTDTEKSTLTSSAEILVSQLSGLKTQLEDNYLTNDINEAFIDYQENDLKGFKKALTDYQEQLAQKEGSLTEQQAKQELLEKLLLTSKKQNDTLSKQLSDMNKSLKDIQSQFQSTSKENKDLAKENMSLLTELNKLKESQAQQ
jgi:hypothetical protein